MENPIRISAFVLFISLMSLGPACWSDDASSVRAAIEQAGKQFADAYARGDAKAVAAFYAEDVWPDALKLVVGTPEAQLETAAARKILPQTVPLRDAVFNLQRALLLVRALETGRFGDLREALGDRWHQPTRQTFVPGLPRRSLSTTPPCSACA